MRGSSGVAQQFSTISMSVAGSTRVVIAQITSSMLEGSMSSSTITTKRPLRAAAEHRHAGLLGVAGVLLLDRDHDEEGIVHVGADDARHAGLFELVPKDAAL